MKKIRQGKIKSNPMPPMRNNESVELNSSDHEEGECDMTVNADHNSKDSSSVKDEDSQGSLSGSPEQHPQAKAKISSAFEEEKNESCKRQAQI